MLQRSQVNFILIHHWIAKQSRKGAIFFSFAPKESIVVQICYRRRRRRRHPPRDQHAKFHHFPLLLILLSSKIRGIQWWLNYSMNRRNLLRSMIISLLLWWWLWWWWWRQRRRLLHSRSTITWRNEVTSKVIHANNNNTPSKTDRTLNFDFILSQCHFYICLAMEVFCYSLLVVNHFMGTNFVFAAI